MAVMEQEAVTTSPPRCEATTKAGARCRGRATHGPHCNFHSAEVREKRREKTANEERSLAALTGKPATEALRESFEADPEWLAGMIQAYKTGTLEGKPMDRVSVTNDLLARLYGKPLQQMQAKHEHQLIVVHRLSQALESAAADVELAPTEVRELEA